MPASDPVRLVRAAFEAFALRDAGALGELADPGFVLHAPTAALTRGGEPYVGLDGLRDYLRDATAMWEELRPEPTEFHVAGDVVVAVGRVYAWGAGRVVDAPAAWVWEVRGDRLTSCRIYEDPRAALTDAGLIP
jgi:ketosteroid isomerase-like protein